MKRSFINAKIDEAIAFCDAHQFRLPPWAYWDLDRWREAGPEADEIRQRQLGWDVTDFGSGDYARIGLLAFTIRNGLPNQTGPRDKTYCEKLLLVDEGQETPTHCHKDKMEDIINRGGGRLVLELWHATEDLEVDTTRPVTVSIDGLSRTLDPGETLVLGPGESITLEPMVHHRFFAEPGGGMVLGGEVSKVNDDANDNFFVGGRPRFSPIDEDEPARYVLCNEYAQVSAS